jgi:hypothetical protein
MTKRLSLSFGEAERAELDPYTRPGTSQHAALQAWAKSHGTGSVTTAAGALRAVIQAGIAAIREDYLDAGYRQLAESPAWTEGSADRRAARDR